ncbi:hypothetical protein VTK56DRAFT_3936 [Thermocarpiscus australiensis]
MIPSLSPSSSIVLPAARDADTSSVRPRNRRLLSAQDDAGSSSALSSPSRSPSRNATPIPAARIGSVTGRNNSGIDVVRGPARTKNSGTGRGLLDGSWTPSWASVQELASSLLAGGASALTGEPHRPRSRDASQARRPSRQRNYRDNHRPESWGPEPPLEGRPQPDNIAAGSLAKREAALKAMRTASVLESSEGVNGGLGKFKKRSSDEDLRGTAQNQEAEEYLAYIHHVQTTDTYAGVVLKYRCREDAFRKANGLWSRDNIQVRKWLAIPVDACEVKGRPCDPPTNPSARVDLLARTPDAKDPFGRDNQGSHDDFFMNPHHEQISDQTKTGDDDMPWTHVRWVSIDSCPHPVEVARVPRKALGYFPPRRKKSIHTVSTLSTPRESVDIPALSLSEPALESPRSTSSRRPSLLANANRPSPNSSRGGSSTASAPPRSRLNSSANNDDDPRPAWMRRPGGVGSLGRHVRAPGPERDYLNTWTNKHLPGLNIDSLPSMSIMGSESARFGFARPDDAASAAIVESPFEEGRDVASTSRQQGSGLNKAAAAIETWLRGALERARQAAPVTPVLGPRGRPGGGGGSGGGGVGGGLPPDASGDLIELADTSSDDGRLQHDSSAREAEGRLASNAPGGSSGRSLGQGAAIRGRGSAAMGGSKKVD